MSRMSATETRRILKLQSIEKPPEVIDDKVAAESAVHIIINGVHYVTIMCTPEKLHDLVAGHLLSEGIIDRLDQLIGTRITDEYKCEATLAAELDLQERLSRATPFLRIVTSGCGTSVPSPFTKLTDRLMPLKIDCGIVFDASAIQRAANALNREASIYRCTGGVHAASICTREGTPEHLAEDVGRHNAVDKVIGSCARGGHSFEERFLISTGRLTGDIVLKAARVKIPVVASISALITSGIDVAERTGVTAVGFVRGRRMNIYCHPERVCLSR